METKILYNIKHIVKITMKDKTLSGLKHDKEEFYYIDDNGYQTSKDIVEERPIEDYIKKQNLLFIDDIVWNKPIITIDFLENKVFQYEFETIEQMEIFIDHICLTTTSNIIDLKLIADTIMV